MSEEQMIVSYKGFNKDWKCRDHQYEVGKSYEIEGQVMACRSGFHACEYPLDIFGYYPPAGARFAIVEQSGEMSRDGDDSKVASRKIFIKAEISLPGLIKAAIEYTFSRSVPENGASATGTRGAASATGDQGAASATGDQGAAMASGYAGKAMGTDGNALFLVERDDDYNIIAVWAGIVGKDGINADTWYRLEDGKPVVVS